VKKYIRKNGVCQRYGGITPKTVDRHVAAGKIAKPEFPFQNRIPYWDEAKLDEHDRAAALMPRPQQPKPDFTRKSAQPSRQPEN
jgi:hypothetical protein